MWISNVGITPECVQRFVAIPNLEGAQKACWIFGVGHIVIKMFAVYNGLLIFAKYTTEKCDPVFNGVVGKYDQIFPYFVMDVARGIPGLPGLFIVGALSAALSSMSSCLNSLSGTVYEDFIRPYMPNATEKQASSCMKSLTLSIGGLNGNFHHVCEKSTETIRARPKMKLFSISIFCRRACVLWSGVCCGAAGWRFLNRHSFEWNHFRHSFGTVHNWDGRRMVGHIFLIRLSQECFPTDFAEVQY